MPGASRLPDMSGSVVVVTGAGSGIGRATALLFARQGSRVHAVDVDAIACHEVVDDIIGAGGEATAHVVDCSDAEAIESLSNEIVSAEGRVDVVHLNAGIGHAGRVEDITLEQWRRVIDVNLWGVIAGIRAFLPSMLRRGHGNVIITASGLGLVPFVGLAPYSTTKFALVGLAETIDTELRGRGIRVSAVCPGIVNTRIAGNAAYSGSAEGIHPRATRLFARRGVSPERVARDVLSAVARPRAIVVSVPEHVWPAWVLHRISPRAYMALAGKIGRSMVRDI